MLFKSLIRLLLILFASFATQFVSQCSAVRCMPHAAALCTWKLRESMGECDLCADTVIHEIWPSLVCCLPNWPNLISVDIVQWRLSCYAIIASWKTQHQNNKFREPFSAVKLSIYLEHECMGTKMLLEMIQQFISMWRVTSSMNNN